MDNNTQQLQNLFNTASQYTQYIDPVSFNIGAQMAMELTADMVTELQARLENAQRDLQRALEHA